MSGVVVLGIDPEGDLRIKLSCGHVGGYPLVVVQTVADVEGGVAVLACPQGCCVEVVENPSLLLRVSGGQVESSLIEPNQKDTGK